MKMNMSIYGKKTLKWMAIGFGGVLGALLLLLCALFVFLQTETGGKMIASRLSALLSSEPDQRVVVGKLEGLIPIRIRLDRVTVSDAEGAWFSAENVVLRWSPLSLIGGRLRVEELSASRLQIDRLPPGPPAEEVEESKPFTLPERLPPIIVEHLAVENLALGREVLGQGGVFGLEGKVVPAEGGRGLTASLRLHRKDEGPETRADVTVAVAGTPPMLSARAEFYEAPNGWLAAVLGLDGADTLRLTLEGEGPLSGWKGTLEGSMGKYGSIQTQIDLASERETTLALDGKFQVAPSLLPPKLAPAVGTENHFGLTVHLVPSKSVALERADIRGAAYRLQAALKLDFDSQAIQGEWNLGVEDLKALEPLAESPLEGILALKGTLAGTALHPGGTLSALVQKARAGDVHILEVRTDLRLEPMDLKAKTFSGFKVSGTGAAEGIALASGEELPEKSLHWTLNVGVPTKGDISVKTLELKGVQHLLRVSGTIDPSRLSGALDAVLEVKDLRLLTAFAGKKHEGSAHIEIQARGDGGAGSAVAEIRAKLNDIGGLEPRLAALLGSSVTLKSDLEIQERTKLTLSALHLETQVLQLKSEGSLNLSDKALKGAWKLSVPKLEPMGPSLGSSLAGSLEAEGTLGGKVSALDATVSLEGKEIVVNGRKFQQVLSRLRAENLPQSPGGDFALEFTQGNEKLKASTQFALEGKKLTLASLGLEAPGSVVKGDMAVDLNTSLVRGKLDGRIEDLAGLGRLLDEPMGGSGELSAELSHGKGVQDVKLLVEGKALNMSFGKTGQASLSANLTDVLQAPRGTAELELREFQGPGLSLQALNLRASGDGKDIQYQGSAKGNALQDFDLQTQGDFRHSKTSDRFQMKTLQGKFGSYPLKLLQPFVLNRVDGGLSFDKLAVSFGKGRIQAGGELNSKRVNLDAEFKTVPLEALAMFGAPELSGTGGGRIQVEGDPSRPAARVNVRLDDVRSTDPSLKDIPPATVIAQTRLEGGQLTANAEVRGVVKKPARADLRFPARFSAAPFSFDVSPQSPLQGKVDVDADLANLLAFVPQEEHKLKGQLNIDLNIAGTLAAPQVSGNASVQKGRYENIANGTVLSDLSLDMVGKGTKLEITRLHATDGAKGTLSATGWVDLDPDKKFPLAVDLSVDNAVLIRREYMTGTTEGKINLSGTVNNMALKGKMDVGPADISIPRSLPPEMTELDVIEIHGRVKTAKTDKQAKPRKESEAFRMTMDLRVGMPDRIFLRGRGLDSEWKGNLRITGPSIGPIITGTLTSVRGHFDFLDKRFKLVSGVIQFDGSVPPSPLLNIVAEADAKDIVARLRVSGFASSPKIELESDPVLPSDEILARVLFGRDLSKITPTQALKLAKAAQALSGKGNALDFMDRTRKFLGLDRLEMRESEDDTGGTAVGIGKYLTEDVYVDVQKDVKGKAGRASIEVEVTPNITLQGEAGSDASTGIGIGWKYDY